MRTNKTLAVSLAAVILASGVSAGGSLLTATPAQAASDNSVYVPPVAGTVKSINLSYSEKAMAKLAWSPPEDVKGEVTGYTITLRQTGEKDRTFTTKKTSILIGEVAKLKENTSYVAKIQANVISETGARSKSASARAEFTTPYARTTAKTSSPSSVRVSEKTTSSFVVSWKKPTDLAGFIKDYTVKLKKGDKVVKEFVVKDALSQSFTSLEPNTEYKVEVTATALALSGSATAVSLPAQVAVKTLKIAEPKISAPAVKIASVGGKSASITWKKPTGMESVNKYTVSVREKGEKTEPVFVGRYSANANTARISKELKPNTEYIVSVTASKTSESGKIVKSAEGKASFKTKR